MSYYIHKFLKSCKYQTEELSQFLLLDDDDDDDGDDDDDEFFLWYG